MKNKNLFESIQKAAVGLRLAFKEEKNLTTYMIIALIFFVLNLLFNSSLLEIIIFIIMSAAVISVELINTAIERVVDKFITQVNEDAKFIKDVAAGAVLVFGLAFFIVEGLIFFL